MSLFKIFIIGHKNFYLHTLQNINTNDIKQYIVWTVVNEPIEKSIPAEFPITSILREWDIPGFCPLYQMTHFYQNSVFFNLVKIIDTYNLKHVGFGQYDMIYTKSILESCKNHLTEKKSAIGFYPYNFLHLQNEVLSFQDWFLIIDQYFKIFCIEPIDLTELMNMPLALFHTFIIPVYNYKRMMFFSEKILNHIIQKLKYDMRHFAGTFERVFAIFLNLEILLTKMNAFLFLDGLVHDHTHLRTSDTLRGI